jgi:lipopolysaccharide export system protein LptC
VSGELTAAVVPAPVGIRGPRWPRRVFDALLGYLPIVLMALLALATWWLVKNTPVPAAPRPAETARHEPDYTMTEFMVQRFGADGAMRVQIEGQQLRHYPDSDTLEIEEPRILTIGPDGRRTVASARRAVSNGDASEVQLRGGASVVRGPLGAEEAIEFRGEFLHAFASTERLRSHLPVWVRRGNTELRADGLEYDHLARTLDLKGRTRATFAPPPRKGG